MKTLKQLKRKSTKYWTTGVKGFLHKLFYEPVSSKHCDVLRNPWACCFLLLVRHRGCRGPPERQDLAFPLVELHEIHAGSFLQPTHVALNGNTMINHSSPCHSMPAMWALKRCEVSTCVLKEIMVAFRFKWGSCMIIMKLHSQEEPEQSCCRSFTGTLRVKGDKAIVAEMPNEFQHLET